MNSKARKGFNPRLRVLLIALLIFVSLATLITVLSLKYWSRPVTPIAIPPAGEPPDAPTPKATPSAEGYNSTVPQASPTASPTNQ